MESERFNQFVQLIDGIHKSVNKIKLAVAPTLGVKSVHIFWLYELLSHPEGLTAATLALKSHIDRSLISREVEELCARGYVEVTGGSGEKRKNYNSRIRLTESGRVLAKTITTYILSEYAFYSTIFLFKLQYLIEIFYKKIAPILVKLQTLCICMAKTGCVFCEYIPSRAEYHRSCEA